MSLIRCMHNAHVHSHKKLSTADPRPFSFGEVFSICATQSEDNSQNPEAAKNAQRRCSSRSFLITSLSCKHCCSQRCISLCHFPCASSKSASSTAVSASSFLAHDAPWWAFHQLSACSVLAEADELLLPMSSLKDIFRSAARLDGFTDECSTASWASCNNVQRIKHKDSKAVVCI